MTKELLMEDKKTYWEFSVYLRSTNRLCILYDNWTKQVNIYQAHWFAHHICCWYVRSADPCSLRGCWWHDEAKPADDAAFIPYRSVLSNVISQNISTSNVLENESWSSLLPEHDWAMLSRRAAVGMRLQRVAATWNAASSKVTWHVTPHYDATYAKKPLRRHFRSNYFLTTQPQLCRAIFQRQFSFLLLMSELVLSK